ncbi:hypothetical protein BASA83_012318 [Batrachochytrium salamandrivorans]|nr:hypothetical protein BASA83_012318 [Batrachochytrium salamandrivorans]
MVYPLRSTKRHSTRPCQHPRRSPTNSICSCSVEGMWSSIRFSNNPSCMALCIYRLHRQEDGDPLNPGDKRGIALINFGLKLVCKVLQMRIERFVETNSLLVPTNRLGSASAKSVVGQVVSLVDIIQRRQNAGAKHPCSIHRYPKGI